MFIISYLYTGVFVMWNVVNIFSKICYENKNFVLYVNRCQSLVDNALRPFAFGELVCHYATQMFSIPNTF